VILCIETSCDDTSAAVVRGRGVLSSVVSSQNELHAQFGGVVPEVASRRHTELVNEVVAEAMSEAGATWCDLDAVAVTRGPGLIGALLVGLAAAKAIAYRRRLPLIPVNHIQGHVAANYALGVEPPFLCLVASGGHTLLAVVDEGVHYQVAARTLDDAAGEAFDKGARLLGLGYPGGRELDQLAAHGDPSWLSFPRAVPRGRDFSFSGLKTALLYDLRARDEADVAEHRADIAASYQSAIVRQLVDKTVAAARAEGLRSVAVAGGVAANSALRRALAERCDADGLEIFLPPLSLCTDNAGMIGLAAAFTPALEWPTYLGLDAFASDAEARPPRRTGRARP
jgi:N6-L-threonylcarbamoyladenine synthase